MGTPLWPQYLTAIGSVVTPVLVLVLTGVGWRLRTTLERRLSLEERLRQDRVMIYDKILEPFVVLLMTDAAWQADPDNKNKDKGTTATQTMLSLDYRRNAFKLILVGSDAVVRAYNNLMQYFYQMEATSEGTPQDPKKMLELLGTFLLEIRRSTGNDVTVLKSWDMLEWFMKEVRAFRPGR